MGYFVNVTFESPIINLERVLLGRPEQATGEAADSQSRSQLKDDTSSKSRKSLQPRLLSSNTDSASSNLELGQQVADNKHSSSESFAEKAANSNSPLDWNNTKSEALHNLDSSNSKNLAQQMELRDSSLVDNISINGTPSDGSSEHEISHTSDVFSRTMTIDRYRHAPEYAAIRYSVDASRLDSIYPMNSREYPDYLNLRYRQLMDAASAGRASQYATLTRATRSVDHNFSNQSNLSTYSNPTRLRSQTNELISAPANDSVYLVKRRSYQEQARQSRYNTLTGSGIKEWRHQRYQDFDRPWQAKQPHRLDQANQADWLPPGALIPRIDSSTLRRQPKRPETTTSSIVEESEDAADY